VNVGCRVGKYLEGRYCEQIEFLPGKYLEGKEVATPLINILMCFCTVHSNMEHAMAQLVEALSYKPEGHGFDFRWCQ
jgi:hypothetical protein